MNHKLTLLLAVLVLVTTLLSACGQGATVAPATTIAPVTTEAPTTTVAPATTEVPAATEAPPAIEAPKRLILATTTSTQDSGLLDYLLPDFKTRTGIDVQVVAVGSGQAMEMGQNGDADVLLVHSPSAEEKFVNDGYGVDRMAVMHNDYVIVGPDADPAAIKGLTNAVEAFLKIAQTQSMFISRGDDSGTHNKEKSLWAKAAITPTAESNWYISAGQGMGAVLTMAQEKNAYTLSDRGTYLARVNEGYTLPILVEGDKTLFNPYHVIAVNPAKYPDLNYEGAKQFIEWIVAPETQALIAAFTDPRSGKPLFYPDAVPTSGEQGGTAAALKMTGLVNKEMAWSEAEVKAMPTTDAQYTNKKGETQTYTGVAINTLLELAGVKPEAKTLVMIADDGFTAEITLADVQACKDCIVSFRSQGGFSTVLPGMPGNVQVKGVIELQLK